MDYQKIVSSKITLILLIVLHLIISLLQYDTQDWVVQWDAIRQMLDGQALYEIPSTSFNGGQFNAPNHLPVFFYTILLLVKLLGFYPQVVRVFLWICSLLLTYIVVKASDVNREKEFTLANLFLGFPVLIGVNLIGVFDQMVMMLLMGGVFLILKGWRYAFLGGIVLGLGVMTKVIVILVLPVLLLGLLWNKNFANIATLLIGLLSTVGGIFYYFYNLYGERFIDQALIWQTRRSIETNTIWFYLNVEFSSSDWFWLQFYVMAGASLFLVVLLRSASKETIYISISTYILVFLLVSRVIYSHYMLWIFVTAFPALIILNREEKTKLIILWAIFLLLAALGSGISVVYRDVLEANMMWQTIGAIILNVSLYIVFFLNIYFTILSSKLNVKQNN